MTLVIKLVSRIVQCARLFGWIFITLSGFFKRPNKSLIQFRFPSVKHCYSKMVQISFCKNAEVQRKGCFRRQAHFTCFILWCSFSLNLFIQTLLRKTMEVSGRFLWSCFFETFFKWQCNGYTFPKAFDLWQFNSRNIEIVLQLGVQLYIPLTTLLSCVNQFIIM